MPRLRSKKKSKKSKRRVISGAIKRTSGGLSKANLLVKKKHGKVRIVSRRKSNLGKKNAWAQSFKKARQELGIKGFCVMRKTGGTEIERELYRTTKMIHETYKKKHSQKS